MVSGNSFKTITNALTQNLKPSNLSDTCTPQPVHRLDYPTTGILLIGKTSNSIRLLNKLFEKKEIQKTYYAITIGKMNSKGSINIPINSKPAISNYEVIQTVASKKFNFLNLVKLTPKTGRKHQLRKHLFHIENPILGDKDYYLSEKKLLGKGLYLHAHTLEFIHPFTNKKTRISTELPKRFRKIFTNTIIS